MGRITSVLFAAAMTAASGAAWAADEPKDLVEYREAVMTSLGGHAGAISRIIKQQVSFEHIQAHADAIAATAPIVGEIFPESSQPSSYEKTDALPKIWEQPDAFKAAVDKFVTAAEGFKTAAASGDRAQIMEAFKELGGSCGGCHKSFRAEKN